MKRELACAYKKIEIEIADKRKTPYSSYCVSFEDKIGKNSAVEIVTMTIVNWSSCDRMIFR